MTPLEDARNYLRQALGTLMEVSDDHKRLRDELKEATELITGLWQYANLSEVEGVVYRCGTHREVINRANTFLTRQAADQESK